MIDHRVMIESIGEEKDSASVQKLLLKLEGDFEISYAPDNDDCYMNFRSKGISLLFSEGKYLDTIFLYIMPKEGFLAYQGWIGESVENNFSNDKVQAVMGDPIASGGGMIVMFNMYIPVWCKYKYLGVLLNYQFDKDTGKIDMLTMALK